MTDAANRSWMTDGFLGYGRVEAPIWLLGMEEHCRDDEDAEKRLRLLSTFGRTMSLREAHSRYGFDELPAGVAVWSFAKMVAAEYGGDGERIGEPDGDVFLTELLPLPRSTNDDDRWPPAYKDLFKNYRAYAAKMLDKRATLLAQWVSVAQPRVVIVHGARYHADVEAALLEYTETPNRRRLDLGGKTVEIISVARSEVLLVHNLGKTTRWPAQARAKLTKLAAALAHGTVVDGLEAIETPVEWFLAGMFHHRARNVIPEGLAEQLPGYAHHASRTIVDELVHGSGFRAWATHPSALLNGATPIEACIERDLGVLAEPKHRGSLRKRYGTYARDGVENAHALIRSWAAACQKPGSPLAINAGP